jgi:uncharacterized protein YbcV (DUF1398 family)
MNTEAIHRISAETQEGRLTFPQTVGQLLDLGVESYFVDLAAGRKTFYLSDGTTHTEAMAIQLDPIAAQFVASRLIDGIRAAQADAIRYPEFLGQATAAGVAAYWAFLTGRRVVYLGRQGEIHVEEFPGVSPEE